MGTQQVHHLIAGEWTGEPALERVNPADGADLVAVTAVGTREDAERAVSAARDAQPAWAATPPPARGAILDRASQLLASRADEVARDLTREEGKTFGEARGEVQRAIDVLRYHGGEGWRMFGTTIPSSTPDTHVYTRREPVGVAAVISPWNFPIAIPAWKAAPALIAGNAVVLKPAELTSLTAQHLARALHDAGLPPGVLNVVHGQGAEVGSALVADERVDAVSFTGSTVVGRKIHSTVSERMGRIQLEMGGKNPIIVTEDADLSLAAKVVAASAFNVTGQACTAASRVILPPSITDQFLGRLAEEAKTFQPGNGLDEAVKMGPVVSPEQLENILGYLRTAGDEGGEIVHGETSCDDQLFGPVVVRGVEPDHTIAQEEVFGPVLSVLEVDDFEQAIDVANAVQYGLAAGLCTNDLAKTHRFAERIQAGVVKVNRPTVGLDLNVPFGGTKASSTGTLREQGASATDFYSWEKSIYIGFDR